MMTGRRASLRQFSIISHWVAKPIRYVPIT